MKKYQHIFPARRDYNRFVVNETFEDYALRFTAKRGRKWSTISISNTAIGALSFLALEAIGATITLSFGFTNAFFAIIVVSFLLFLNAIPISKYASLYGLDIDLLTRGAGFGYIGSTITSLIYASFTFILFAIEASIMATALELALSIPLWLCYIIASVTVIPLVMYGIKWISRFQFLTQPFWIFLNIIPLVYVFIKSPETIQSWINFAGNNNQSAHFDLLKCAAAASVIFGIMPQICEQVDILRFLPTNTANKKRKHKFAKFLAGPGWLIIGAFKLLLGSLFMVFALENGALANHAAEPASMYFMVYSSFFNNSHLALILTTIFIIIAQLKINIINAYAGSLAWSNFFSRLTRNHPGRIVWLVFNVLIALALMELGVYSVLERILGLFSIFAVAWLTTVSVDLTINKALKFSPENIEFRRGYLYDINPVGVVSFILASFIALIAYFGLFGEIAAAFSSFIALFIAFIITPCMAYITKGRYYFAREAVPLNINEEPHKCAICEHEFESEDMVACPAYSQFICSLCCSLDSRCHDLCKPEANLHNQIASIGTKIIPKKLHNVISERLWRFLFVFFTLLILMSAIIAFSYYQGIVSFPQAKNVLLTISLTNLVLLTILVGLVSWFYTLSEESRLFAEEESQRQNQLLQKEIDAHKITDSALQMAKETAEAANSAKSRYIVGMSHELRTPLNAILGYAQLLEDEQQDKHKAIRTIRRSGEHLSSLIDGLLDISRIETGRLQLQLGEIRFNDFLVQIIDIFRLQALEKGLEFNVVLPKFLPKYVRTDEKRLRQVLINLLSNAVKYTDKGQIDFIIEWKNGVATIHVKDSGKGIEATDFERVFEPFVRIETENGYITGLGKTGLGLGLTITKLLLNLMGGDIELTSEVGVGTCFTVKIMLSSISHSHISYLEQNLKINAYTGARKTVMIVDDDLAQRELIHDLLTPLGFLVLACERPSEAMTLANDLAIDLFILDIQLPEISGFDLAKKLRSINNRVSIIMLSTNITEIKAPSNQPGFYDALLGKPFSFFALLKIISNLLKIEWIEHKNSKKISFADVQLKQEDFDALQELGKIGYAVGIEKHIEILLQNTNDEQAINFLKQLQQNVQDFDFEAYQTTLKEVKKI